MTMSLDGAITGIGAAGDAVASGSGLFRDTEGTNRATMNAQLPE